MDLALSFVGALFLLICVNLVWRGVGNRRRARAAALPEGEAPLRQQSGVGGRIFADRSLPGGLKAGTINRVQATLVLSDQRLLVCTRHGRVLELTPERPGEARCVGPKRVVLEGAHPSGRARLRVELVLDAGEAWVEQVRATLQTATAG